MTGVASAWVQRWSHLVAPGATVLDVGCGQGRHVHWFARRGHPVTGVDRSVEALQATERLAGDHRMPMELVQADIENGPWPLMDGAAPRQFGAIVVTNYLWRPLVPTLLASLGDGSVLLYETFAQGNATVGRPSRPDFLLRRRELIDWCGDLHIVAFEDGFCDNPARFVQRIAAVKAGPSAPGPGATSGEPVRYAIGA